MANLTFLDLMLAEALASRLAREARRAERPPPDNFFLLPRDPDAWQKIQEASRKENMVVCIEFTDNSNENCKRAQGFFMDLAREFDGIPFVRAVIGLGNTYNVVSVFVCKHAAFLMCVYVCIDACGPGGCPVHTHHTHCVLW